MLKLLIKLKSPIWFRKYFWKRFWQKEQAMEKHYLGENAPEKPIQGSERAELIEAIVAEYPFSSLLEVACSYGQNFSTIAHLFPDIHFSGIDKDERAINEGRRLFANQENVSLAVTDARDLSMFQDKSFDLVVSCAFFLYVWPDDVAPVLSEMFRVAKRKIILMEQHQEHPAGNKSYIGTYYSFKQKVPGYWLRDYKELFSKYVATEKIKIRKIPNPRFEVEQWGRYASLIEVDLS